MKSFYHQLQVTKRYYPKEIDNNSSSWHVKYYKRRFRMNQYEELVLDTMKRPATYEKFGLNYFDLMKLPIPIFDKIRELILQIDKAVAQNAKAIQENTKEFMERAK